MFSADDLASCILKMKAIRRKPFHLFFHLIPTLSAFAIVLWLCAPFFCPLFYLLLPSRTLHCLSIHPRLLPANELRHHCLPFLLDHSYQCRDRLKYLPSLKQTHHIFLQLPFSKSYLWLPVLPISFGSITFRVGFFVFCGFFFPSFSLYSCWAYYDLLGDTFPSQFSVLILLDVAAAFDMVDNFLLFETFFPLASRTLLLIFSFFFWFFFVAPTSKK